MRMQISLGDEEVAMLDRECRATGLSRSELIRRAVRRMFGKPIGAALTKAERLEALRESAGVLSDWTQTGAEYVDEIRGDLNERLRRLGFE